MAIASSNGEVLDLAEWAVRLEREDEWISGRSSSSLTVSADSILLEKAAPGKERNGISFDCLDMGCETIGME